MTFQLRTFLPLVLIGILMLIVFGCATGPDARSPASLNLSEHLTDSHVDISYVLGHDSYRLAVEANPSQVLARSFLDQQILEENRIDRERYSRFLERANQFIAHPQSDQTPQGCRNPFKVTVRLGRDIRTLQGCRNTDEGALSHLVREGEFLLYSKK